MTRQKTVSMLDFEPVDFEKIYYKYIDVAVKTTEQAKGVELFLQYLEDNHYMLVQPIKEKKG